MIETLNECGRVWANYFVWAIVQNTLFLGLVFLVLQRLRRAPANTRYAFAAVGLVKLLLPPFVPARLFATGAGADLSIPSTYLFSFTDSTTAPAITAAPPLRLDLLGVLFVIWAATALFIVVRAIILTARLASAVKDATPVTDDPASANATGNRVALFKSDRIGMPLTIGVFPNRVFVPSAWDRWTPMCRRVVLRHELAHIRRLDGLFQLLELIVQALYFFHPLVLLLNRRLREYREMACDDASVGYDRSSRIDYSKFLLELAESAIRPPARYESVSALLRKENDLLKRVAYQVKEGTMNPISNKAFAALVTALILAFIPFSIYQGCSTEAGPEVANAGTQKSTESYSDKHKFSVISVSIKQDIVVIDGKKTPLDHFTPVMGELTKGEPDNFVIKIDCDDDTPMATLFNVQKQMVDMGLVKVAYDCEEGSELPMVLPGKDIEKKLNSIRPELIIELNVDASGEVYIDKKKVSTELMNRTLQFRIQEDPKVIVSMYMDEKTRYDDFVKVLANVKQSGADKVVINNPVK